MEREDETFEAVLVEALGGMLDREGAYDVARRLRAAYERWQRAQRARDEGLRLLLCHAVLPGAAAQARAHEVAEALEYGEPLQCRHERYASYDGLAMERCALEHGHAGDHRFGHREGDRRG